MPDCKNEPERKYLKEAPVGMAVMDLIPVLLFGGTAILLASVWKSPVFLVGSVCSAAAGFGKALWKLILAVSGKNVVILNRQFRYLMSSGFLLMIASLLIGYRRVFWPLVWKNLTWFPGNICFLIGLCGMILMGVLAAKMDHSSKRANWLEQSVNLTAQLAIFLGVLLVWYGSSYYPADAEAEKALEGSAQVSVKEIDGGLYFRGQRAKRKRSRFHLATAARVKNSASFGGIFDSDGEGTDRAVIFYPGAKVEYTAYAPLLERLAENGIDGFLLEMPYHLAIFGKNRAESVMNEYAYDHWYLAGHSLGGAMAADFAADPPEGLDGLILLAAYPTKKLPPEGLSVLSIYGSEDDVLSMEKLESGMAYLPEDSNVYCIEGGNHAGFGSYGPQKGDGAAGISQEEQWNQTAEQILKMFGENR